MNTKHRWYDVIVAWAEGKEIQERSVNDFGKVMFDWSDFNTKHVPNFMSKNIEWRVKPTTVTKKYRMAHIKNDSYEGCTCVEVTGKWYDESPNEYIEGFVKWAGEIVEIEVEE